MENEAVDLVTSARSTLNLNELKVEDLAPVCPIALESGRSVHLEIPLEDDTNENSCAITYYEVGMPDSKDDLKLKLTNKIVMQYL